VSDRPDLHTPEHDQWDQGGFCNNLVTDDDGCGTTCGYQEPWEPLNGEIVTPLDGTVLVIPALDHLKQRAEDPNSVLMVLGIAKHNDYRKSEIVLSEQNRRDLAARLLDGLE
jgi:hypothetical protein